MDLSLLGKRALVCGSTQGIGHAAAVELAKLGASITLLARDAAKLEKAASALPRVDSGGVMALAAPGAGPPQSHDFLIADFADLEAVRRAAGTIRAQATAPPVPRPIHILVNNTGGPPGGPIAEAQPDAFSSAFSAHVLASHALAQAVLPGMKAAGYGRIINIISTSVKAPIPGLGVSNTIRAAMASWAKTLAGEVGGFGVTVNNVLPGYTETERLKSLFSAKAQKTGQTLDAVTKEMIATIPAGRLGRAEEIAAAVAFLASPAAAYINGINLPVDGGRLPAL